MLVEIFTKVTGIMIKEMDMVCLQKLMAKLMKAIGKTIKSMGKRRLLFLMAAFTRVNGEMVKNSITFDLTFEKLNQS